jgi:DNA-directed RNA polymerase subunit D
MKFKVQELNDNNMKFIVTDSTPSFVNTLRRVLLSNIPKMAIEDVEFHLGPIRDSSGKEFESISPLFDEIIAHRLGLIPIPTDLSLFKYREDCECKGEGCPNCTIMFNLNKKGPCTVYSGDLEPLGDSKFRVTEDLIPIVKLGENQALLIYATAELGTTRKHAKWQVTSGVGYKYYPKIEIKNELFKDEKMIDDCVEICPKNIFEKKNKKLVVGDNIEDCLLCNTCQDYCVAIANEESKAKTTEKAKGKGKSKSKKGKDTKEESTGAEELNLNKLDLPIRISSDDTKFIFRFETDGSMGAKEAFEFILNYLEEKFNDFRDQVSKLK